MVCYTLENSSMSDLHEQKMDKIRMNMKAYPITSSLSNNTLTMSSPRLTKRNLPE